MPDRDSKRTVDFHGLRIERRYAPLPGDGMDTVLGSSLSVVASSPDILLTAHCHGASADLSDRWQGLPPVFYLGQTQAWMTPEGYVLTDGISCVSVDLSHSVIRVDSATEPQEPLPPFVRGMQHLALGLLLREFGIFAIHAAALVANETAILIPGDCSAGKTTTALALIAAGCGYLGDDRVLLRRSGDRIELLAYPREFHVDAATAHAFPQWNHAIEPVQVYDGKTGFDPLRAFGKSCTTSWTGPVWIWFPAIDPNRARSGLEPISQAEAFGMMLGASALALVDGIRHTKAHLEVLRDLVSHGTSCSLRLGADMLTAPQATARRLLAETVETSSACRSA